MTSRSAPATGFILATGNPMPVRSVGNQEGAGLH